MRLRNRFFMCFSSNYLDNSNANIANAFKLAKKFGSKFGLSVVEKNSAQKQMQCNATDNTRLWQEIFRPKKMAKQQS